MSKPTHTSQTAGDEDSRNAMSHTEEKGAAIKVLHVLDALAGYAVNGVANTVLAAQLGMPPSGVTRAMDVLIQKGWARKNETTGHFHPTPRMARVFGRVLADLDRAQQTLTDTRHNFTHR